MEEAFSDTDAETCYGWMHHLSDTLLHLAREETTCLWNVFSEMLSFVKCCFVKFRHVLWTVRALSEAGVLLAQVQKLCYPQQNFNFCHLCEIGNILVHHVCVPVDGRSKSEGRVKECLSKSDILCTKSSKYLKVYTRSLEYNRTESINIRIWKIGSHAVKVQLSPLFDVIT